MKNNKKIEKFLCLVLRHNPELINVTLDSAGWIDVSTLVKSIKDHTEHKNFSLDKLKEITTASEKQRFEYIMDGWKEKIRARQGHSVSVDLGYLPSEPPEMLYHGSEESARGIIFKDGIKKMTRHAIHLYEDKEDVIKFSKNRKRNPLIYQIDCKSMYNDGIKFYCTKNNVWLVEYIAPQYILSAEEV